MKKILFVFLTGAVLVFAGSSSARAQSQAVSSSPIIVDSTLFVVGVYETGRNPADDLDHAVTVAGRDGKRILLDVGGEWCSWCHALDRFLAQNSRVTGALRDHFVIVKVNFSEDNQNESFLSNYPKIPGYPHLFVLDTDGKFLFSQGTGDLEEGKSYSEKAWLDFITRWKKPSDNRANP